MNEREFTFGFSFNRERLFNAYLTNLKLDKFEKKKKKIKT